MIARLKLPESRIGDSVLVATLPSLLLLNATNGRTSRARIRGRKLPARNRDDRCLSHDVHSPE